MKKSKCGFSSGDLVAVFGAESGKEGQKAEKVSICVIVAAGDKDLIVEPRDSPSYSSKKSYYIVPQDICRKLSIDPEIVISSTFLIPKIGDLVLSYVKEVFKNEDPIEITGILYSITYKLGKPTIATLLMGTEMKEVPFSSLMVLQRN
jgi:hypothetical protein